MNVVLHIKAAEEGLCFFCARTEPRQAEVLHLYKVTGRSSAGNNRRVTYREMEVTLPICSDCVTTYGLALKATRWIWLLVPAFSFLGAAIAIAGSYFVWNGAFVGFIIGLFATPLCKTVLTSWLLKAEGILKRTPNVYDKHPLLKEYIKDGWTTQKPAV